MTRQLTRPRRLRLVRPAKVRPAWLVLAICDSCNVQTGRYCREHSATNWWFENWWG